MSESPSDPLTELFEALRQELVTIKRWQVVLACLVGGLGLVALGVLLAKVI